MNIIESNDALNCKACKKKFSLLRPIKKCEICFEYYCNEDAPRMYFRGEEKRKCLECKDALLYDIINKNHDNRLKALRQECCFLESQESDVKITLQNQENICSTLEHVVMS